MTRRARPARSESPPARPRPRPPRAPASILIVRPGATCAAARELARHGQRSFPRSRRALRDPEPRCAAARHGRRASAGRGRRRSDLASRWPNEASGSGGGAHTSRLDGARRSQAPRIASGRPGEEVRLACRGCLARVGPDSGVGLARAAPARGRPAAGTGGRSDARWVRRRPRCRAHLALFPCTWRRAWKAAWALGEIVRGAAAVRRSCLVHDPDVGGTRSTPRSIGPDRARVPTCGRRSPTEQHVRWRAALAWATSAGCGPGRPDLVAASRPSTTWSRRRPCLSRVAPEAAVAVPALADALRRDGTPRARGRPRARHGWWWRGRSRRAGRGDTRSGRLVRMAAVRTLAAISSQRSRRRSARALGDSDPGARGGAAAKAVVVDEAAASLLLSVFLPGHWNM